MSQIAVFFLLIIFPLLAILLAWLGVATLPTNPFGWILFLAGSSYAAGVVVVYFIKKKRFWESAAGGTTKQEEHGDRSFWLIALAMCAAFYASPVEYILFTAVLPRNNWMSSGGIGLFILGIILLVWARRTLQENYSGHLAVKAGQTLIQNGPYRFIRHPAYAGYLLMALGISLGYSSLAGLISLLVLLLPGLAYRMNVEEKLLIEHFGNAYRQYARQAKRLIPGIW